MAQTKAATQVATQASSGLVPSEEAPASSGIDALLQKAVEQNIDVEKLERLLAMKERHDAEQARRVFFVALAEFQAECPAVVKRKAADRYKYAPLSDVIAQVGPVAHRHGFSHRFDFAEEADGALVVRCVVTHRAGHSETTTMRVPRTAGRGTNAAQDRGGMATYGQRYAYIGAYGITTADADMDARLPPPENGGPITDEQLADLRSLIEEVNGDEAKIAAWAGCPSLKEMPTHMLERAIAILERRRAGV